MKQIHESKESNKNWKTFFYCTYQVFSAWHIELSVVQASNILDVITLTPISIVASVIRQKVQWYSRPLLIVEGSICATGLPRPILIGHRSIDASSLSACVGHHSRNQVASSCEAKLYVFPTTQFGSYV